MGKTIVIIPLITSIVLFLGMVICLVSLFFPWASVKYPKKGDGRPAPIGNVYVSCSAGTHVQAPQLQPP